MLSEPATATGASSPASSSASSPAATMSPGCEQDPARDLPPQRGPAQQELQVHREVLELLQSARCASPPPPRRPARSAIRCSYQPIASASSCERRAHARERARPRGQLVRRLVVLVEAHHTSRQVVRRTSSEPSRSRAPARRGGAGAAARRGPAPRSSSVTPGPPPRARPARTASVAVLVGRARRRQQVDRGRADLADDHADRHVAGAARAPAWPRRPPCSAGLADLVGPVGIVERSRPSARTAAARSRSAPATSGGTFSSRLSARIVPRASTRTLRTARSTWLGGVGVGLDDPARAPPRRGVAGRLAAHVDRLGEAVDRLVDRPRAHERRLGELRVAVLDRVRDVLERRRQLLQHRPPRAPDHLDRMRRAARSALTISATPPPTSASSERAKSKPSVGGCSVATSAADTAAWVASICPLPRKIATDVASSTTSASCAAPVPIWSTSRSATAIPSATPKRDLGGPAARAGRR